ncbi:MAG: c-type cytochrome [Chloroflexi bacterium]|nr:c-type cytochrome [Chloroflexota bacterium]MCI0575234.1 c-type cytochrome [Chloroflexota bacterium]MCI0648845.1 c-type cytochrome [Chloroflexota bacterium]MCI0726600.1 c-type cytochrome [Chloroflexota bacterium]
MAKVSIALVVIALLLLLVSVVPWPSLGGAAAAGPETAAPMPVAPAPVVEVTAAPDSLAGRGQALFMAKGCPTCHRHEAIARQVEGFAFNDVGAPDLTNYQGDPEFLRTWLKDPAAVRPGTFMPNLGLSQEEIEALIAFLTENEESES